MGQELVRAISAKCNSTNSTSKSSKRARRRRNSTIQPATSDPRRSARSQRPFPSIKELPIVCFPFNSFQWPRTQRSPQTRRLVRLQPASKLRPFRRPRSPTPLPPPPLFPRKLSLVHHLHHRRVLPLHGRRPRLLPQHLPTRHPPCRKNAPWPTRTTRLLSGHH